jgi:hypothetical protein
MLLRLTVCLKPFLALDLSFRTERKAFIQPYFRLIWQTIIFINSQELLLAN